MNRTNPFNTVTLRGMLALSLLAAPALVTADTGEQPLQFQTSDSRTQHPHHDPVRRTQRNLDQLAGQLQLTAAQQPAWQTFSESAMKRARERAAKMQEFHAQPGDAKDKLDAATRMEKMAGHLRARADTLEQAAQDTRALQRVLTPAQQEALDGFWKSQRHHGRKAHRPA